MTGIHRDVLGRVTAELKSLAAKMKGCKAIAATCCLTTFLSFLTKVWGDCFRVSPYVLFVAGHAWSIVTASFVEIGFLNYVVAMVGLVSLGLIVERELGWKKTAEYLLVVAVIANAVITFTILFWWHVATSSSAEYVNKGGGSAPLVGALAVVVKQLLPETHFQVSLFMLGKSFKVRGANMPHVFAGAAVVYSAIVGVLVGRLLVLFLVPLKIVLGVVTGWAFLRFFQRRDGRKGDKSDVFAFVTFFPDPLQPGIGRIIDVIEDHKQKLQHTLGMAPSRHVVRQAYKEAGLTDADTTRHRNIGLELLEQQMASTESEQRPPSIDMTSTSSFAGTSSPVDAATATPPQPVPSGPDAV